MSQVVHGYASTYRTLCGLDKMRGASFKFSKKASEVTCKRCKRSGVMR